MSREDKIRAQKRNLFQQKQQVNRLYAQRRSQGMTPAQAATTPYTVTDTDTLETIASANGVNPVDVLSANPDMKKLQTGMVINVGSPLTQGKDVDGAGFLGTQKSVYGGMGLPSNAQFGYLMNNRGENPYDAMRGRGNQPSYLQTLERNQAMQQQTVRNALTTENPYQGYGPNAPRGEQRQYPLYKNNTVAPNASQRYPLYANSNPAPTPLYPIYAQNAMDMQQNRPTPNTTVNRPQIPTAPPGASTPVVPTSPASSISTDQARAAEWRQWTMNQMSLINAKGSTYVPSPVVMKYLSDRGLITQDTSQNIGGGFGGNRWRSGGRGGGGGGGGRRGGGGGVPRAPAFSTGNGFGGLVNWRI